jgi:hypothetical protein
VLRGSSAALQGRACYWHLGGMAAAGMVLKSMHA